MSSVSSISSTSIFNHAQAGVQKGQAQVAQAASAIANGDLDPQNLVDLIQGQHTVSANLAVLKTEDEILGTILDTKA